MAQADLILFHFPVWWFSMPAILKGWVDRVFARGFAYSAGRKYGKGHFFGKKAMICLTTGTDSTLYEPNGIDGDLLHVLWPIHNGILAYTGFTVLPPFAAWMPGRVSADERQGYLDGFARHLTAIEEAEPLFFHPWEDYDETQRLKPGIKPAPASSGTHAPARHSSRPHTSTTSAWRQKGNRPMTSEFQHLHHVCVVVADMDRAVACYESLGIGPWHPFPSLEAFRPDLQAPDVDDFMKLEYRYAELGNVQLQLCCPPEGNTLQRRFLDEHGEGVFHLGFSVPDVDAAEARVTAAARPRSCGAGCPPAPASPTSIPTPQRGSHPASPCCSLTAETKPGISLPPSNSASARQLSPARGSSSPSLPCRPPRRFWSDTSSRSRFSRLSPGTTTASTARCLDGC